VDREDDVRGAAERVAALFGGVDLMINCSAMLHPSGRGETSLRNVSAQVMPAELT
jgi:NAD(P)-dependent dehydrogenase (short-subunit alcohol dehydrogenase family)